MSWFIIYLRPIGFCQIILRSEPAHRASNDSMLEEVILLGTYIYMGKFITGDAYAVHPAWRFIVVTMMANMLTIQQTLCTKKSYFA